MYVFLAPRVFLEAVSCGLCPVHVLHSSGLGESVTLSTSTPSSTLPDTSNGIICVLLPKNIISRLRNWQGRFINSLVILILHNIFLNNEAASWKNVHMHGSRGGLSFHVVTRIQVLSSTNTLGTKGVLCRVIVLYITHKKC